ncbi:hypothetical protein [Oleiharenicola sp. Vm1]|uniref:hypothetical protein n=1 Tax=Oleiharenicola sp. Vm1 TaxID=3398393 RepID=UPI0039F519F6
MSELYPATHQPTEASTAHDKPSWPSGERLCEQKSPASAFAVAGGSPAVPICELLALAETWKRHADTGDFKLDQMGTQTALLSCALDLHRLADSWTERQPQENK